jgi:hypothetical protein
LSTLTWIPLPRWKPNCSEFERRFTFVRTGKPIQRKEPEQLSLFAPPE